MTWSTTQVAAVQPIEITNISGALAEEVNDPNVPLYAEARPAGQPDADFLPLPLYVEDSGAGTVLEMPAPFDPMDPTQAAQYDITIVAGDVRCDGPTLDVAGMSPGSGSEVSDYVSSTEALLVDEVRAYGITNVSGLEQARDELVNQGTMPPLGMLSAIIAFDALESFEAEVNQLSADQRAVLEAYMAHLDFESAVSRYGQALSGIGSEPMQTASQGMGVASEAPDSIRLSPGWQTATAPIETADACGAITGEPVSIDSAAELDYYMTEQQAAADALSGYSGDIRKAAMAGAPLLGLVSGGTAAAAGLLLYVETTIKQYSAQTLPSEISNLDFAVSPGETIPEDYEVAGEQAYWHQAVLEAESSGHNLTGAAIGALSQVVGAGRYFEGALRGASAVEGVAGDLIQNDAVSAIQDAAGDVSCLEVPSQTWGGIDVTDPLWTEARVEGDAFTLGPRERDRQDVNLARIGTAQLVVETLDQQFGAADASSSALVEVAEQEVIWEPQVRFVSNLGDPYFFDIVVEHTARPNLAPTVNTPAGVDLVTAPTSVGGGRFDVTLGSPGQEDQYPAVVTASRPGVLPPANARTGEVEMITERRIDLTPASACVQPDDTQSLTATLTGFESENNVNWAVTSGQGTITPESGTAAQSTATLSPTTDEGVIVVEATATDDTSISDTSRISVGTCDAPVHVTGVAIFDADFDASYNESLPQPPLPPERPDSYWQGRVETLGSSENGSGYLFPFDGTNHPVIPDSYEGILSSAISSGDVRWAADANGGVNYRHDVATLADECHENPYPDSLQGGDVGCTHALSTGLGQVRYYIDHAAAATYEIVVQGECSTSGDAFAGAYVLISGNRFTSEAPESMGPLNGPFLEYPDYSGGEFIPPTEVGIRAQDAENVCGSEHGGTFSFTQTLDVGEPVEENESDLVYFTVSVTSALRLNHFPGFDPEENLEFGGAGSLQLVNFPDTPAPGDYTGSGDIEFDIVVRQQ